MVIEMNIDGFSILRVEATYLNIYEVFVKR